MSIRYITATELKQYDTAIKGYIENQINSAVDKIMTAIKEQSLQSNNGISMLSDTTIPDNTVKRTAVKNNAMSLFSINPESISVQEDIQEDYIIYDRVITPNENISYKNIVVTGDDKSNRIFFNMWHTFDNRDLLNKEISIIWINANDEKGMSLAVDKEIKDGNRLVFAWNVPIEATYIEGTIQYAIRITDDNYAWHTLPSTIECVKGLMSEDFNSLEDAELSPGWVDYIEGKYQLNLLKISQNDYEALSPKDNNTMYVVEMNDNTVALYLGDKMITAQTQSDESGVKIVKTTVADYESLAETDPNTLYLLTEE